MSVWVEALIMLYLGVLLSAAGGYLNGLGLSKTSSVLGLSCMLTGMLLCIVSCAVLSSLVF